MKKLITPGILAGIVMSVLFVACKKSDPAVARPKEQLIVAKWSINRIQLKAYMGGTLIKDSIAKQTPLPENYVIFNAGGTVEYRFNKSTSDYGTYQFVGEDSIYANIDGVTFKWKNLLLTETNFNVVTTTPYPTVPGATVDVYQTFVR